MTNAIVIHGLRRSGTTIFWETLRSSASLLCFDEPFHPRIAAGSRSNEKGTWAEYGPVVDCLAPECAPQGIAPEEELQRFSSKAEMAYFRALCTAHDRVVIDVVRCWARLPGLYPADVRCLTVQLIRDPVGWVTAHLLPTGPMTWRKHIGDAYRRLSFFRRHGFYDNYQYETIVDEALARHQWLWADLPIAPAELARQPAFIKLLAFWWCVNLTLRRSLLDEQLPHLTVTLQDFVEDPSTIAQRVCCVAGWEKLEFNVSRVRPVRPGWRSNAKSWLYAAELLGIPKILFQPWGQTAETVIAALDKTIQISPNEQ